MQLTSYIIFVLNQPMPLPNDNTILCIEDKQFYIDFPFPMIKPLTDKYEDFLLRLVDINDLIKLWMSLILEKSVIFVSKFKECLFLAIEALSNLAYPLELPHIIVSTLP